MAGALSPGGPALPSSSNDHASLGRRRFLQLAAGSAAAVGLAAIPRPGQVSAEDGPPVVPVTIEELTIAGSAYAAGVLDGVTFPAGDLILAPGRRTGLYTSGVLRAKDPFTHVGLRWRATSPLAIDVSLRASSDGSTWTDWRTVHIEHNDKSVTKETFASPVNVGRATQLQIRVAFDASRGSAVVSLITAALLNATDAAPRPTPGGALEVPSGIVTGQVFRREHWGADESKRFKDGAEWWHRMYVPVKKIVVHHTAGTNDFKDIEAVKAEVRADYAYHATTLDWGDIGYNMLIDRWGNIYEGRHGRGQGLSREAFSPGLVAGHALDHNYGSVGIALIGTFTKPGENQEPGIPLPEAMERALVDAIVWQCQLHNIDPSESSDYLLVTDEWNRGMNNVSGHRDCNTTLCPGGYVYDRLPLIRAAVAQKLRGGAPALRLRANGGQRGTPRTAQNVQFDWGSERGTGRYVYLLEGWRRFPKSEDVEYLTGFDGAERPAWQPTEAKSAGLRELLAKFGGVDAEPDAARYTFHVAELDDAGKPGFKRTHTLLLEAGDDMAPSVQIASPRDNATLPANAAVRFEASASDAEDGDLSYRIAWTSSRDGELGRTAIFTRQLSAGDHAITASITDSNGVTRSQTVKVRVS